MSDKMIIILIMSAVSFVLLLVPTLMTVFRKKKLDSYEFETDAEVVDCKRVNMHSANHIDPYRNDPMWIPTFRYSYGGHTYQHESHVGTTKKLFEKGDKVPIKVSTQDPTRFVLVKSYAYKLATIILYITGAFFTAGTIASAILIQRLK